MDEGRERAEAAHRAEKKREQNEAGAVKAAKAKREAEDAGSFPLLLPLHSSIDTKGG